MKKAFLSILLCSVMCICCGERPSYDDAIEDIEKIESYEEFARFIFETEGSVASAAARCYGEDFPPEFIASRDGFYSIVDERIMEYRRGHFVEQRIVLYEQAVVVCEKLGNIESANAVKALLKHCSAALYIDGQRVCDPPLAVRKRYEEAKNAAQRVFE